jgi:hypothetical protein
MRAVYWATSSKEHDMHKIPVTELSLPNLGLLAATRGMLGAGVALLLAEKLTPEQRKSVGWTLAAIGLATTVPLAMIVFGGRKGHERA